MRAPRVRPLAAIACLLVHVAGAARADEPRSPQPAPSDLVERAAVQLVQVDVSVFGPPELVRQLTADDFTVKVGLRRIESFELDNLCAPPAAADEPTEQAAAAIELARPATFVFYFDQPYLTGGGRARSLQVARGLIEELIRDGNRAMIVSNAAALKTYTGFTEDAERLREAISVLQDDRSQWDFYATDEEQRIAEVVDGLNEGFNTAVAMAKARIHQREERWRVDRDLRRLDSVLVRLAGVDPPKAVIYFADTIRSNAGEHYLSFFGDQLVRSDPLMARMQADSGSAPLAFDRLVDHAAAEGIRFYAIQGDDLQSFIDRSHVSSYGAERSGRGGYTSRIRVRDSQATLSSLSAETGGQAFLHGSPSGRIAERIRADFDCLCLISFPPSEQMLDKPYRVVVESRRPGVEARARGRVVMRSESARRTSELLAAFVSPEIGESTGLELRSGIVPLGFERKSYAALVQIILPAMPLAGTTWDMGATLYGTDVVRAETSGRLSVDAPGVPLILESEIRFPPGEHDLVSVAQEARTGLVVSSLAEIDWPDPNGPAPTVGPIVLLQSTPGVFLRDDVTRTEGLVCVEEGTPVRARRPVVLVALVCRERGKRPALRLERTLQGRERVGFEPIVFDSGDGRCVQVRDVIPEGTLGPGGYVYALQVVRGDEAIASGRRSLTVLAEGE